MSRKDVKIRRRILVAERFDLFGRQRLPQAVGCLFRTQPFAKRAAVGWPPTLNDRKSRTCACYRKQWKISPSEAKLSRKQITSHRQIDELV